MTDTRNEGVLSPLFRYRPGPDGIRALAVLAVFGYHFASDYLPGGFIGVDLFFVLSGYLITATLLVEFERTGSVALGKFYARRALRLVPALVAGIALAVVVTIIVRGDLARVAWDGLWSFLYVNDFVAAWTEGYSALTPTWSLAVEEQFYLIWPPLLVLVLQPLGFRVSLSGAAALGLLVLAIKPLAYAVDGVSVYNLPWGHFDVVLVGAALALVLHGQSKRLGATVARGAHSYIVGVVALLALAASLLLIDGHETPWLYWGGLTGVGLAAAALIAHVVSRENGWISRALGWRPLVEIGKRSYGLYLYQIPARYLVEEFAPELLLLRAVLGIGLTFSLAWISYRWLELPFQRRRKRFEPQTHGTVQSGVTPAP